MHNTRRVNPNNITPPTESLEYYFRAGGVTIIQAAFSHSFFIDPESVRGNTPSHPDRARMSREHYPGKGRGQIATWQDDGRTVKLGDNAYAQIAWRRYTSCPMQRGTGYGVRHIWGHPWNPDAFTAGWNLCYMPFWAGMLTENQHPLSDLQLAIKQASWDLYFRENQVCDPPEFVKDQGIDLHQVLDGQRLLIMAPKEPEPVVVSIDETRTLDHSGLNQLEKVKAIRTQTNRSWVSIYKGVLAIQGKAHEPFGTTKVAASSKSIVRRILRETGLTEIELETLLERETPVKD
ncbi:MAG: hypothetical protein F4Y88_02705 [Chloroflexi bacterium]|nr:hypothetical protein [Chloroflexota bacterium]